MREVHSCIVRDETDRAHAYHPRYELYVVSRGDGPDSGSAVAARPAHSCEHGPL